MDRVLVALGSNLGDRVAQLRWSLDRLASHPRIDILRASRFYETSPVGGPSQGDFLNACVLFATDLEPRDLLHFLHDLEREVGRVRGERNGPRTLDLDILLFGARVIEESGLRIPHPRMADRPFVLVPACEVAPDVRHPVLGELIRDIALPDTEGDAVRLFSDEAPAP